MITSKLTSKAQTTIPQAVRSALGIRELLAAVLTG
jgi:bifunctional DNA-binding transcriptional regulator/antitoxin component of YhaV-PrlF toxin-antitoxin module